MKINVNYIPSESRVSLFWLDIDNHLAKGNIIAEWQDVSLRAYDTEVCELCGASPLTVNCNNGGCDV